MTEPKVSIFIDMRGENNQRLIVDGSLHLLRELWASTQSAEPLPGGTNQLVPNSKNHSSHESDFQAELVTAT